MEKRDEEWRIAERKVVLDSWRIWADSADWPRGAVRQAGKAWVSGGMTIPPPALFGDRVVRIEGAAGKRMEYRESIEIVDSARK